MGDGRMENGEVRWEKGETCARRFVAKRTERFRRKVACVVLAS